jgi:glutamyl-tRNA reductase
MTCDLSADERDECPSDGKASTVETESHDGDASDDSPDVDEALAQIRARGESVRERELETALGRLDAHHDLSAAERAELERLSRRLVEQLLAVPERGLREAAESDDAAADDDDTAATALELFG